MKVMLWIANCKLTRRDERSARAPALKYSRSMADASATAESLSYQNQLVHNR